MGLKWWTSKLFNNPIDNTGSSFENNQIMDSFKGNNIQSDFISNNLKT